ncbi:hypothetical protein [Proteiniphilum saccharofermentans]|uniref:hypothetical protein n=1 Tax=Proteiniphilum saccharofermentans TaxID=1642647 RepID=UPI0028A917C3|nr:hypothetical protein [Proteiniphilum saccharofermentans]
MKHLERALQGKNGIGRYILMAVIVMVVAQIAAIPLFFDNTSCYPVERGKYQ